MFSTTNGIAVEAEFGHGLSGSRVFRVRQRSPKKELCCVGKEDPLELIAREQEAYQTWVENTLQGVARLEQAITPSGSLWAGLRYSLASGDAFEVQGLPTYYAQASSEDLRWLLEERLYPMIGLQWWRKHYQEDAFQMQADYDSLLPVNLTIKPATRPL